MAQLALGLVGSLFGPVGTMIGAAVGAAIDSMLILPAIMGGQDQVGPRINELRQMDSSEGSPMNFMLGISRVNGMCIWTSGLIEKSNTEDVGKSGSITNYSYSCHIAVAWCEGIRGVKKIWANKKLIYDVDAPSAYDSRYAHIYHYSGTDTQTANSLIEATEGMGNVPGFRGTCYTVIESLALRDFGDTIPQFEALVEDGGGLKTVPYFIEGLFQHAGFKTDYYDISTTAINEEYPDGCLGVCFQGMTTLEQMLDPFMTTFNLITQEGSDGTLEIRLKSDADTIELLEDDLGVGENNPGVKIEIEAIPERDLPANMMITFVDAKNDHQQGQKKVRNQIAKTLNDKNINLPIVMIPEDANKLAQRLLWQANGECQNARLTLPPTYLNVQEGDLLLRDTNDPGSGTLRERFIRVQSATRGHNFVVEMTGVLEQPETQSAELVEYPDLNSNDEPLDIFDCRLRILGIPPINNAHVNLPGVYAAACRVSDTAEWAGCRVFYSLDGGSTYDNPSKIVPKEATMGETDGALPDWSDFTTKDTTSTLTVTMINGTLTSATAGAVASGVNWALVGNEIIAFETANLVGAGEYELSNLYRGLRNTQFAMTDHVDGEDFVLLNDALIFLQFYSSNIGTDVYYKAVPAMGLPSDYSGAAVPFKGETVIPFSPFDIAVDRDGSNNATISWTRQTRILTGLPLLGYQTGPLEEPFEKYRLIIWEEGADELADAPYLDEIVTGASYEWSAADQTTAGLTPGDLFLVKVKQIGNYRPGRPTSTDNL